MIMLTLHILVGRVKSTMSEYRICRTGLRQDNETVILD